MEPALLASQLALSLVFATAGAAKLADLGGSRRAVAEFGVPQAAARGLGAALPFAELAVAGALLPQRSAVWGAGAALALLGVFGAAIGVNLARGRRPECRCFGQVRSAPTSWRSVARNVVLASLAAALLAGGPVRLDRIEAVVAAVAVGSTALLLVVRGTRRRAPGAAPRAAGLPIGDAAPEFELPSLGGGTVTLAGLLAPGKPVLLVFADAGCGPCRALAPEIAAWQATRDDLTIAVLERGGCEQAVSGDEHGRSLVLCPADEGVAHAYRADGTPSAVLVDAAGRIASSVAPGGAAIRHLVAPEAERAPRASHAGTFTRLEFVAKLASATLLVAAARATPALAGAVPIPVACRHGPRCGGRCCPKTAECRRRGQRKVCVCPDGREACGSKCCPPTFVCRRTVRGRRVCACPARTRACGGRCVPLTDPAHCGRCGRECPPATVCVGGECVGGDGSGTGPGGTGPCTCPPGRTCCDGGCVDLNSDEAHCGRCDQPCPEGQTCCDGACTDLQLDRQHCGRCGNVCPPGLVCNDGRCDDECPAGKRRCDGRCVDGVVDDRNCGGCPDGSGGQDCLASNLTCCSGTCVNTSLSSEHCGGCDLPCPPAGAPAESLPYWYCRFGTCVCPLGYPYGPCP